MAQERLNAYFKDYASSHRTPGNKATHYIGIPSIMVSLLGLLSRLHLEEADPSQLFRLDGGVVLWSIAIAWYLSLSWRLAIPFSLVTLGAYFAGRALPMPVLWALFIGGWIFQLVGHSVYEKKSPAFLTNLKHLLIGPLWIFARLFPSSVPKEEALGPESQRR